MRACCAVCAHLTPLAVRVRTGGERPRRAQLLSPAAAGALASPPSSGRQSALHLPVVGSLSVRRQMSVPDEAYGVMG